MKKFFTQLVAIVATLGLQKKFETKTLSAEEMNQLTDAYNKAHGEGAFAKDFAEFQSEQDAAQKNQVYAESLNAIAEELGLGSEGEKTDSTAIVAAIKELKNSFEKMASKAEEDKPTDHASQKINITGVHTKDFAFGVQNPMFSASKRWNKLAIDGAVPTDAPTPEQSAELRADFNKFAASLAARYAALNKSGQINRIAKDGVDFSAVAGVDMSDRFFFGLLQLVFVNLFLRGRPLNRFFGSVGVIVIVARTTGRAGASGEHGNSHSCKEKFPIFQKRHLFRLHSSL